MIVERALAINFHQSSLDTSGAAGVRFPSPIVSLSPQACQGARKSAPRRPGDSAASARNGSRIKLNTDKFAQGIGQ